MGVVISKVLVVFIYIAIGFITYRLHVFNDESIKHLTAFILNITCPAMMISSVAGADLDSSLMSGTIFILISTYIMFAISSVLALWISRKLRGVTPLDANVLAFGMSTTNSGFMGFPVTMSVFGPLVFYYMVIENISLNLYLYTIGIWQLNFRESSQGPKKSFKDGLRPFINPIIISALISMFLLFLGIKLPAYFMDICDTIGDATIPTSMILVGIQLGASDLRKVLSSRPIFITSIINLIIVPLLALLAAFLLPVPNIIKLTFALSTCFPAAAIGVAISASEGRNASLYAEIVAATTLLSMITLPIWIVILSHMFPL